MSDGNPVAKIIDYFNTQTRTFYVTPNGDGKLTTKVRARTWMEACALFFEEVSEEGVTQLAIKMEKDT